MKVRSAFLSISPEQRTTAQGQVYFIHRATGVSTWHDPRFRDVELDPHELGSLPDGWETRYTAHGRRYFVNHLSRTTQFTGEEGSTVSTLHLCTEFYFVKLHVVDSPPSFPPPLLLLLSSSSSPLLLLPSSPSPLLSSSPPPLLPSPPLSSPPPSRPTNSGAHCQPTGLLHSRPLFTPTIFYRRLLSSSTASWVRTRPHPQDEDPAFTAQYNATTDRPLPTGDVKGQYL